MKIGRLVAIALVGVLFIVSGCIKNTPYVTTIDPSMTADIGTYKFNAETVVPSTVDSQVHDTITGLMITGNTSDQSAHHDKMVVYVNKYKGVTGTFSIVRREAYAYYLHSGVLSPALGGVVAITRVNSNNIVGYFSFTTADGLSVQNGNFTVGRPDNP